MCAYMRCACVYMCALCISEVCEYMCMCVLIRGVYVCVFMHTHIHMYLCTCLGLHMEVKDKCYLGLFLDHSSTSYIEAESLNQSQSQ